MTKFLSFYGASDDLFEIEDSAKTLTDEISPGSVEVRAGGQGIIVTAEYGKHNGCWMIGVTPLDEDVPFPDWGMAWHAKGYSTVLVMEVPDNAKIRQL